MSRILASALVASIVCTSIPAEALADGTQNNESTVSTYDVGSYENEMFARSYTNISKTYSAPMYQGSPIEVNVEKALISDETALESDHYGYKNKVVDMMIGDVTEYQIEVTETAQYALRFDYYSVDSSVLPIELSLQVNGEYPFYEARRLIFETTWVADEEKSYDRYNNEIVTIPNKVHQWETKYLMDASYRKSQPLLLELEKGTHTFRLEQSEGSVLIGNMYLEAMKRIPEYQNSEKAVGEEIITIEAERFTYRNDSSIRAVSETDVDLTPYEITDTLLNAIDKDSFKNGGQQVTYQFPVKKAGYYYIALNYKQGDKGDFPVFTDVRVNGEIPHTGFTAYPLSYTTKYKTERLTDVDGAYMSVYLEEGENTVSFTINMDKFSHILEGVMRITSEINDLSLEITKVAGTNKDKYRDLKLTKYIPNVQEVIYGWADELIELRDSVSYVNPDVKKIAALSQLTVAATQLRSLAKDPDELQYRVVELSTSVNSVNTVLANSLDTLNKNQLSIDRIYLFQEEASLPKKVGFFEKMFIGIKRFVSSFFDQAYSTSNVDEENLQVWVNRQRQHLDIMQKMIDEQFTPQTGIKVDLSLMPDPQKLVLANASDDAPDIATGLNYALPFDLGVRGAIKDLTEFDDFVEIANRYQPGMLIPGTIEDGIYSLPETMNFWVLFYRTDVMSKLGLEVPDTMEELVALLPELQMRGLNFFYPTASMLALRNFHGTTPLLFQNGATLYGENAKAAINSEEAVESLKLLTELFTIYNIPKDVPSFYQHFRNGDLPIGIADFYTYNLLVNAAPEIANSWEIGLVPGTKNEEGEVLRYTAGGAESTIMFNSTAEREDDAWKFMKWWSSAEVQVEYGQTLQITYGDEYIWSSANLEAFGQLPIDSKDKEVISEQSQWVMEAPRVLGSYMFERELSNAYNNVVIDGQTLRQRIDKAIKRIDRETERKLEEFGYLKDGLVIKEYTVPTIDTVNEILGNK